MSDGEWTVATLKEHYDALRQVDQASVLAALRAVEKANEVTALALNEYKASANEWRATFADFASRTQGTRTGSRELWGFLVGAIGVIVAVASVFLRMKP